MFMQATARKTKIFLDSGNPDETNRIFKRLGFLDGQTTNPSLVAKNPEVIERIQQGKTFSKAEITGLYKNIIEKVSSIIPKGSVSIEVYADHNSSADDLLAEGREMFSWIPNAHIKYPITLAGLDAARRSVAEGMRVNMTLCFSQEQAAAVYTATKGAKPGDVFISPFVGRLDDQGMNGMEIVRNIIKMYAYGDGHVQVLAASVRSLAHLHQIFSLQTDIATVPFAVLNSWADGGMSTEQAVDVAIPANLREISYREIDLNADWQSYNIQHDLTDIGLKKFADDWNHLLHH
ncbi:MAG: transaldolase family protein [Patescibacteria group bacterium]|jgi:transaldolase